VNRTKFLDDTNVKEFICWLVDELPKLSIHLCIARSPRSPVKDELVRGIENVLRTYRWNATWTDATDNEITSTDWKSTHTSLSMLATWAKNALNAVPSDSLAFEAVAAQILIWGGVPKSLSFLARLHESGTLIPYFKDAQKVLALADADVGDPYRKIQLFNSGLTKIHALVSDDGLPIYDSRVGAAIGGLVALFEIQRGNTVPSPMLKFPSGSARGEQIRDAGELWPGMTQSQFYTRSVSHEDWAKAAVKLGWILGAVLEHERGTTLFNDKSFFDGVLPTLSQRMHAFEAALFMIGYDLCCLSGEQIRPVGLEDVPEIAAALVAPMMWESPIVHCQVITSHPFSDVLTWYNEFRTSSAANYDLSAFSSWLQKNKGYALSSADSYCYPLRAGEFDIANLSDDQVSNLAHRPLNNDVFAWLQRFSISETEHVPNCLIAVFLVGTLYNLGFKEIGRRVSELMGQFAFASKGSASINERIGRQVGAHFGILDSVSGKPTDRFFKLFS
jgi:hypothetical protein